MIYPENLFDFFLFRLHLLWFLICPVYVQYYLLMVFEYVLVYFDLLFNIWWCYYSISEDLRVKPLTLWISLVEQLSRIHSFLYCGFRIVLQELLHHPNHTSIYRKTYSSSPISLLYFRIFGLLFSATPQNCWLPFSFSVWTLCCMATNPPVSISSTLCWDVSQSTMVINTVWLNYAGLNMYETPNIREKEANDDFFGL